MSSRDEDRVFSSLASGLKVEVAGEELKQRIFDRVAAAIDAPPPGGKTVRSAETDWLQITPAVEVKILMRDEDEDTQSALWRLQPGAIIPPHNHLKNEECLVLEGEFHVGDHILAAGDFHVMEAGSGHPRLTTPEGCLLFIRQGISRDLSWIAEGS